MRSRPKSSTVLAVLQDKNGKLVFAGDRRISWGDSFYQKSPVPKILKRNGLLFAGCGSCSISDEIIRLASIPAFSVGMSAYDYAQLQFLPAVLDHLRVRDLLHPTERRLAYKEHSESSSDDSSAVDAGVLVGIKGELFECNIDNKHISIIPVAIPYTTGCGGAYAMGSLLTTEGSKLSVKSRLKLAVEVAARCNGGCDDNVDFITED